MVSLTIMPKDRLFWIHDTDLRPMSHPIRTDLRVWKQFWRCKVLDSNNKTTCMHSCPHPVLKGNQWERERPSSSRPPCHSCRCGQVSEFQPWVFLHTLRLSESMFSLHWNPFHCFWTYWSSAMHILIILFMVFLPAGPHSHYFCIGHSVLTADANHASYKCISKAFSL